MELPKAKIITNRLVDLLSPVCEIIEPVGSVKRGDKPEVHDIEILLIAKTARPVPVFGQKRIYETKLDELLADMEQENIIKQASKKADGPRYKKRALVATGEINEFCLDLFIVTEKTWGLQNVIRTGPALFSHRFVTNRNAVCYSDQLGRKFSGFLPNDLTYVRGETVIRRGEDVLSLPWERDVIDLLGVGWIPWHERGVFALEKNFK